MKQTSADLLLRSLVEQGTKFIFGIPGGKIMPTFDALNDLGPKLIVCRHEQNASFMAAAVGRLTGRPGVCLVTSGPGTSNVITGAATATSEGDPMVAIGGVVALGDTLKQVHQTMDSVAMMRPVTKYSVSIPTPDSAGEAVVNAFRAAMAPRPGAAFIAFPQDVQKAETKVIAPGLLSLSPLGPAPAAEISKAAIKIQNAKQPVLLVGLGASEPRAAAAVRGLLKKFPMPVAGTFQGAGTVSRELAGLFCGRVGLFRNQPGDKLLALADVVVTVGYDPVEYGPEAWNVAGRAGIVHIDDYPCEIDNHYQPEIELRGSVEDTLSELAKLLKGSRFTPGAELQSIQAEWKALQNPAAPANGCLVHPLNFVVTLRKLVDDSTIIASDMGSHHIWMARHFFEFEPRKLLFSNGQQTLGVGIPWAMAASFLK